MKTVKTRIEKRNRRRERIRAVVSGTAIKPRLNVFRSLKGLYIQLIDDEAAKTLVSVNAKEVDVKKLDKKAGKVGVAEAMGKLLAEKAKAKKIAEVVFDRAGYKYHGRVKAVAEGAREGGLKF